MLFFQPEPFFITLALYDAREGKKISEDFHFDPNGEKVRAMIPSELVTATDSVNGDGGKEPHLFGVDSQWLAYCDRVSGGREGGREEGREGGKEGGRGRGQGGREGGMVRRVREM